MCGISAIRADLRISIQARGAPNLVVGHLATGLLADDAQVLVPNPPSLLLDNDIEIEVWIIPTPVSLEDAVEVIDPLKKNFSGLEEKPDAPTVAMLTLAHCSRYHSQVEHCDAAALGQALTENGGDLWAAMRSVGAIPETVKPLVEPETLLAAAEAERQQRRPRQHRRRYDDYERVAGGICDWVCFCINDPDQT